MDKISWHDSFEILIIQWLRCHHVIPRDHHINWYQINCFVLLNAMRLIWFSRIIFAVHYKSQIACKYTLIIWMIFHMSSLAAIWTIVYLCDIFVCVCVFGCCFFFVGGDVWPPFFETDAMKYCVFRVLVYSRAGLAFRGVLVLVCVCEFIQTNKRIIECNTSIISTHLYGFQCLCPWELKIHRYHRNVEIVAKGRLLPCALEFVQWIV